jgi:pyruvate,water dikinase
MAKKINIFDNSNLNESYSGVVTPLTFSFAKRSYEKVYLSFCKLLGVNKKNLKQNSNIFPNMVAYLGGRMYYDLINWYRLVALLPGYKFNRGFFEKMLGVEENLAYKPGKKLGLGEKIFDFINFVYRVIKMTSAFIFIGKSIKKFNGDFDKKLLYLDKTNLRTKGDRDLVVFYESFEDGLTKDFSVPIINDFAVMISTGILKTLTRRWLNDKDGSKANCFISGRVGLKSAEPGRAIQKILESINANKDARRLFQTKFPKEILLDLEQDHSLSKIKIGIDLYIKSYGSRMPGELKLESISFQDDPLVLIEIIKNACRDETGVRRSVSKNLIDRDIKKLSLIKKPLFNFVLKWARRSVIYREETRFKRAQIFGVARRVFREFGTRLKQQRKIASISDVFYLSVDEIFTYFGSNIDRKTDFYSDVQQRKNLAKIWKRISLPRRIKTSLSSKQYNNTLLEKQKESLENLVKRKVFGQLVSLGSNSPFVVGRSLVTTDFDPSKNYVNKILITRQTDPGWTIIFPYLKGLVVERGGSLSHAAIVAREFGIPCIINAADATKIIPDDRDVIMDLKTGQVNLNG